MVTILEETMNAELLESSQIRQRRIAQVVGIFTLKICILIARPSQLLLAISWAGSRLRRTLNASNHTGSTCAVASFTA